MIKYTPLPTSLTESNNLAAPRVHKTENEQQLKKSSVVNGDPIEFIEVLLLQGRKGQLCTKKIFMSSPALESKKILIPGNHMSTLPKLVSVVNHQLH